MTSSDPGNSGRNRQKGRLTMPAVVAGLWVVLAAVVIVLHLNGSFTNLDNLMYDSCFHTRNALCTGKIKAWKQAADESIAIVTVDDLSLDLLGIEKSPTRGQWADLVSRLGPDLDSGNPGAAVLAFDYYLPRNEYPPKDLEYVNRNLVRNADLLLQNLSSLSFGEPRPESAADFAWDDGGFLAELDLVSAEHQEFLESNPDPRFKAAFGLIKEREREIARNLSEDAGNLRNALKSLDPRLVEALEGTGEGFVNRLRMLYGTIVNSLLVSDLSLASSMLSASNVVLAKFIDEGGVERESDQLFCASAVGQGLINAVKDPDGKFRSIPFVRWKLAGAEEFEAEFALSVMAVIRSENLKQEDIVRGDGGYRFGKHNLPPSMKLHINYIGGPRTFRYIPLYRVLHDQIKPEAMKRRQAQGFKIEAPLGRAEIDGKIILIGDTSKSGQDMVPTPFAGFASGLLEKYADTGLTVSGGDLLETPGVECHANAVFSIINNTFITPLGDLEIVALVAVFACLSLVFYLPKATFALALPAFVLLMFGLLAVIFLLFSDVCIWCRPAALLAVVSANFIAGLAYQGVVSQMKKKAITSIFGKYVSDNLVKKMVSGNLEIELKGRTREVTVLFSDIRGFTKISEGLEPEMVGTLLRVYFSRMIKTIFRNEGTLNKLMGDAIMAFFGDPEEQPDHPIKAASAALDMLSELAILKRESDIPVLKDFAIGIGLNTGMVTVGNLGSDEFVDYTVIGDNVNLGSRLEGLNKEYGSTVLISEFTQARIKDAFETRALGKVRVVGKTKPVAIYELLSKKGALDPVVARARERFAEALNLWHLARFPEARAAFEDVLSIRADDGPAKAFIARCDAMIEKPPEEVWDGVFVPTHK